MKKLLCLNEKRRPIFVMVEGVVVRCVTSYLLGIKELKKMEKSGVVFDRRELPEQGIQVEIDELYELMK